MTTTSPIFCGIDISSDTSKCAIAIGEASSGASNGPTLRVTLRDSADHGENDWNLPTVTGLLQELSARCNKEQRKAIVAIDIPFGYPKEFAQYLTTHPLQTKRFTDELPLVDDLMYRGCEKQLKHTLLAPESWETVESRLPLWQYYLSLKTEFFSDDDQKRNETRNDDGTVRVSRGFPVSPLCTVADKIGRAISRWIRVACELNARSVGPSVWSIEDNVYLFECYPLASLVSSGLWHPDLKSRERGRTTRTAAVNLLRGRKMQLTGGGVQTERQCGDTWGYVECGDMTASDHTFDALVCTCTAWWCGGSLLSRYGVVGVSNYPKPPLAIVSDQCFTDPTGNALDKHEGGIYYPKTPDCLLEF
jgi:hypothetical protein